MRPWEWIRRRSESDEVVANVQQLAQLPGEWWLRMGPGESNGGWGRMVMRRERERERGGGEHCKPQRRVGQRHRTKGNPGSEQERGWPWDMERGLPGVEGGERQAREGGDRHPTGSQYTLSLVPMVLCGHVCLFWGEGGAWGWVVLYRASWCR